MVLYLVCVGIALGLAIAGCAQAFADQHNEYNYALRQWRALTNNQVLQFQTEHKCCNFDSLSPCCRFSAGSGECANTEVCYDQVTPHLESNFELIAITSLFQALYLLVVFLLAAVLCKFIERNGFSSNGNKGKDAKTEDDYHFDSTDDDYFK